MSKSQNVYDDPIFFEGYRKLRSNQYSANNLEEKPAIFSLAPDLDGQTIIDLGCGYGENCAEFKARGASAVLGVDISEKMLEELASSAKVEEKPRVTSPCRRDSLL